jgi:cardiolipin synthase
LEKLLQAREKIQITTPYFFPTSKVFDAILKKANDGVSITVLLPLASDVMVSKWITQYHYERLMKAGVQIHEYTKAILHAKSTLVDDWALIGTSNMNRRSVYRDLEIDYIVSQPYAVKQILTQFEYDLKNSVRVTSIPKLNIGKKIVVLIATKLFSSWF